MSEFATVRSLKPAAPAPTPEGRTVIERLRAACVAVRLPGGQGSGFLIDPRGFVITNQHVVGSAPVAVLDLADKTRCVARVLRSSRKLDLALLLISAELPPLPTLPLAVREPEYGERVLAFGNPMSLEGTLTQGIVSHPGREMDGVTMIQTDASVNPGNSGGPLVSSEGFVLGVNSWGLRDATNLNFAIGARHVRDWLPVLEVHLPRLRGARYCNICGFANLEPGPHCLRCGAATRELKIPPEVEKMQLAPPSAGREAVERRQVSCSVCRQPCLSDARFCRRCGATLEGAR